MRVFDFVPEEIQDCYVTAWIHDENKFSAIKQRQLPAIIICPGGGYGFVSNREAEPVAQYYFAAGYNTFILHYSVGDKAKDFCPLCQLASTVAHIRKHATELYVNADKIAVCGFSAGGHLAGSLGTLANTEEFKNVYGRQEDISPNAMILIYPVITADEYAHVNSIRCVSGSEVGTEKYQWFGLDKHVTEQTPSTFLYHTMEDACVPVQNSMKMAEALANAMVPYELHILPNGGHGMSVCTESVGNYNAYNGRWVDWSIRWLNTLFGFRA